MLNNTRGIIATYLGVWRYLPDAGTFSVREWMQDETRTGCLPLQKNVTQFDAYNTAYMRGEYLSIHKFVTIQNVTNLPGKYFLFGVNKYTNTWKKKIKQIKNFI